MINVGSQSLAGKVLNVKKDTVRIEFTKPVCANIGDKISIRPGLITKNQRTGAVQWREIES